MSFRFNIYVLKLSSNKYYIGKTTKSVQERFLEHVQNLGLRWTKLHGFIEIVENFETSNLDDEDKITKKYMGLYGIENVRGGSYTQINLADWQIKSLEQELKTTNKNNIPYFTSQESKYLCSNNLCSNNLCFNSNKSENFGSDCENYLFVEYVSKFDSLEKIKKEVKNLELDLELKKILSENIQITKYLFDYKKYIETIQYINSLNEQTEVKITEKKKFIQSMNLFANQEHYNLISKIVSSTQDKNIIDEYFDKILNTFEISKSLVVNKQIEKINLFLLLKKFISNYTVSSHYNYLEKNLMLLKNKFGLIDEKIDEKINVNLLEELYLYLDVSEQNYLIIINKIYLFRRENEIELDNLLKKYSKENIETFDNEILKKIKLLLEKQIDFV